MGRAKLKMELIAKEKSRNSTYFKRKKGLLKKLDEFNKLCAVDTLMIVYGPKQGDRPVEVETFPPDLDKVDEIIKRYQQVPEEDKVKRSLTIKNFFEDQKRKSEAELVKLRNKNQELPLDDLVTVDQLQNLYHRLDAKKELVEQRINSMKAMNSSGVTKDSGSKRIAEFPNSSVVPDQIPYQASNTYNNNYDHDTLWRREDINMHSQPFGYPSPMEYHHLNTTKDENLSTPMFVKPMIGSDYGYLSMGNQFYYANQHMGSAMMSTASMYHPLGQIPPFQMQQQQFQFMNTPQTHHQQQFMSSGFPSQQSSSSHFGFQDQIKN
ncbi:hypothetical protein MKW92_053913 [Papaver armeniacum]|nr:hypothetical protein MKW92_053913 [Papaver armeniacum]